MRTQSHVCENPISAFSVRSHDLVILVSHNAYYVYIQNSFLWKLEGLRDNASAL